MVLTQGLGNAGASHSGISYLVPKRIPQEPHRRSKGWDACMTLASVSERLKGIVDPAKPVPEHGDPVQVEELLTSIFNLGSGDTASQVR
jgi:hypothetical protein